MGDFANRKHDRGYKNVIRAVIQAIQPVVLSDVSQWNQDSSNMNVGKATLGTRSVVYFSQIRRRLNNNVADIANADRVAPQYFDNLPPKPL